MSRPVETLADTLVEIISPALITVIVGSLACFLVEVLYQGEFNGRLQFILCLFVMGTVGIARISMQEGSAYASLFAAPLALLTALALFRFVEFGGMLSGVGPILSLGLMFLCWWCSHQLTVDSTLLERQQDSTGTGLLSQLGWEQKSPPADSPTDLPDAVSDHQRTAPASATAWWNAWLNLTDRPHAHGKWALYFAIAAVPIFGAGQFFLGQDDLAARRWVFQLLVLYVASSLALLLATSFLGLRRYLKKRKLELPLEMATGWLMIGGGLIAALLFVAFLLPRPLPEYSMAHLLPEIRAPQRQSSPLGLGNEGVQDQPQGKSGEGQQNKPPVNDGSGGGGGNEKGSSEEQSKSGESSSQQDGSQGKQQESDSASGKQSGDDQQPTQSGDADDKGGKQGQSQEKNGQEQQDQQEDSKQDNSAKSGRTKGDEEKSKGEPSPGRSSQHAEQDKTEEPSSKGDKPAESRPTETAQATPPPPSAPSMQWLNSLPDLLNWLGMLVMLVIACFVGWKYREPILAALRQLRQSWLDFLAKLFGQKVDSTTPAVAPIAVAPSPPRPFSSFADPFATGDAQRWPLLKLLSHSFAALEAFGRERSCARHEDQTPAEFAQAVADRQPAVATEVQQLAQLYGQVAYGPGVSGKVAQQILQRFWQRVRAAESS